MRLSDKVAEKLLTLIQQKGLQVGDRLSAERNLAAELGVSRPSLREAIQKLASQGILVSRRGDGTYVQGAASAGWLESAINPLADLLSIDPSYRYDILETRQAVEGSTAYLAAQRATAQDKVRVRQFFDVMMQYQIKGNYELAARADAQFHLAIAEASLNVVLLQVMRSLFDLVLSSVATNRYSMLTAEEGPVGTTLAQQHEELMLCIENGNPEGARQAIASHLGYVSSTLLRLDEDQARKERVRRLGDSTPDPLLG